MPSGFKKFINGSLIIAIILPSVFLAFPQPANAYVWTSQVAAGFSLTDKEVVIGWDTLAWAVSKIALSFIAQITVNWVRTGNQSFSEAFYGGAQAWILNFEQYLIDAADHAAGIFIGELLGSSVQEALCSPFRINLNHYFTISGALPPFPHAKCTLTQLINNIENFQVDFSQGGSEVFLNTWLNPANNPVGAILAEEQRREDMVMSQIASAHLESQSNQGFLGIKKCVKKGSGEEFGEEVCLKYENVTPGKAVQDQLAEALRSEFKGLQHADEISELVAQFVVALASALIQRGLNEGL